MQNQIQVFIFFFIGLHLFAQQKGVSPTTGPFHAINGNTYAVVIGISDYQDKDIPDLKYAHRDAEAFANFLRSPSGGPNGKGLDDQHMRVLTNQNATAGKIAAALYWLVDECKAEDQVIIYYSGHGDVERKFVGQPGFLLCWDSPAHVYMAGGTIELGMLQSVISTLTVENKAKVLMISDACHAGKLAGSSINGTEVANTNLARQFGNETKILSCQPNEFSLEGVQWGGGRGAFSYHLVNALYGMANSDSDSAITLKEVSRYLDEHIPKETAPEKQNPVVIGDKESILSTVIPHLLASLRNSIHSEMPSFTHVENRGLEELVMAEVDSNTRLLYRLFIKSLEQKSFFEPAHANADYYYEKLIADVRLKRLHNTLKRNYAAALQDDAQQAVNNIMQMEKTEIRLYRLERIKKYAAFPRHLEKAAELLGRDHYQYTTLQARKSYFEGWVLQLESSLNRDTVLANKIISKYNEAIHWTPDFSPPYLQISQVYRKLNFNIDSCDYYASKVLELSPNWIYAINDVAYYNWFFAENAFNLKRNEIARNLYKRSLLIDSSRAETWTHLAAFYYFELNRLDSAQYCLWKSLSFDSTHYRAYYLLGILEFNGRNNQKNSEKYFLKSTLAEKPGAEVYLYLGAIYHNRGDIQLAKQYYEKALEIEPTHESSNLYLTDIYLGQKDPNKAFQLIQNVLKYDSLSPRILPNLIRTYTKYGYFNEAEKICMEAIARSPINLFHLGDYYLERGKFQEAEEVYLRWVLLDTTKASVFRRLANFYKVIKEDKKTEAAYIKCISLDSINAVNLNSLGWFYWEKRQNHKAEQNYIKAIAADSNYFLAWINLGLLYNQTSRYKEAEKLFLKAISLDSMRVNSWINLGKAYEGLEQFEKMEWASRKAISLQDNNARAWLNLAFALYNLKQFENAEWTFKKAISMDSLSADTWNLLGYEFSRINLLREAELAYKKAILYDSTKALSYNNLAWIFIQLNQFEEGETHLLKAINLDTNFVNPHTLLALIYLSSNRKEEARRHLERAIELNPEFYPAIFGMTYVLVNDGKYSEAFVLLEQAIQKGLLKEQRRKINDFSSFKAICVLHSLQGISIEMLQKDEQLSPLRDLPEWQVLMKKYFPDKMK